MGGMFLLTGSCSSVVEQVAFNHRVARSIRAGTTLRYCCACDGFLTHGI